MTQGAELGRVREALAKVTEGRSYTKEHYWVDPSKFVGRVPAREYDEALDAVLAWAQAEMERQINDPPPAPLVVDPKLMTHLIGSGTKVPPPYPAPQHIDGDGCDIPGCDHKRSNRGYDMRPTDG